MDVMQTEAKPSWSSDRAGKYLTFKLANEFYGIEILKVREIIGLIQITHVPRMPDYVKGVINLRGKVIPIIDLRLKFGLPSSEYTKRTSIIVVEVTGHALSFQVGAVVDEVDEVLDFAQNQIEPAPEYGNSGMTDFILAMGKVNGQVKILLDIDKVITHGDIAQLTEE